MRAPVRNPRADTPRALTQTLPEPFIVEDAPQRRRQRVGIVGWNQDARVATNELGDAAGGRTDNRNAAGKRCTIGCNLETDLGQAPMTALAAGLSAFPIEQFACDLPAILFYEASSVKKPLVFRNGRIELSAGAGFGVEPLA